MKRSDQQNERACSICGTSTAPVFACDGGQVCETCAETTREGRDNTSRALKTMRTANERKMERLTDQSDDHDQPAKHDYAIASGLLMCGDLNEVVAGVQLGSGGEVISQKSGGIINTLTEPTVAALEASNHRTELLTMLGTDIAAMALDAADTIGAGNSMEKMLAHQMAGLHDATMKMLHRAHLMQDSDQSVKYVNAAIKASNAYQGGLGTLARMRDDKQQRILVQHVNVSPGGQAIVGTVQSGGGKV